MIEQCDGGTVAADVAATERSVVFGVCSALCAPPLLDPQPATTKTANTPVTNALPVLREGAEDSSPRSVLPRFEIGPGAVSRARRPWVLVDALARVEAGSDSDCRGLMHRMRSGGVAVFVDESTAAGVSHDRLAGVDRDHVGVVGCGLIECAVGSVLVVVVDVVDE